MDTTKGNNTSKDSYFQKKRKHYRLNYLWELEYQVISSGNKEEELVWFKGVTTDISGGGCRFNSERQQEKDDILTIKIGEFEKMGEGGLILKARVISSLPLLNRQAVYENRV